MRQPALGRRVRPIGSLPSRHGRAWRLVPLTAQEVLKAVAGIPGAKVVPTGGDGIADDPACTQDAGANAAGIYATVPIVDAASVGSAEPVIAAFKSAFPDPKDYGAYTVIAYDAAAVVYDALDRAIKAAGGQAPPRGNVISQLSATRDFDGVTGVFGFDAGGDSTRRVLTVYESLAEAPRGPWKRVSSVDYTGALPY